MAPRARRRGVERYQLSSRAYNGIALDLVETYRWGWEELYRIESEMASYLRPHPPRRLDR